jgi:hypothetical protein
VEQINKNYQQYHFQPISLENNENSSVSVNSFTEKMTTKITELKKEEMIVMNRTNEEIRKKEGILETVKTELQVFPLLLFLYHRMFRLIYVSPHHHFLITFLTFLYHIFCFYFLFLSSICKLLSFFLIFSLLHYFIFGAYFCRVFRLSMNRRIKNTKKQKKKFK